MACAALRRPFGIVLPLLGAFAFLVHPEAVAVYPLFAALSWIREREHRRKLIVDNVVLAVFLGAITAIRFACFGDIVPNTFHAKPGGVQLAVQNGYNFLMGKNTNVAFRSRAGWRFPCCCLATDDCGKRRRRRRTCWRRCAARG